MCVTQFGDRQPRTTIVEATTHKEIIEGTLFKERAKGARRSHSSVTSYGPKGGSISHMITRIT
jgi:hypothetical protein